MQPSTARRWGLMLEDWTPDNRLSLNGRRRTHPLTIARLQREAKLMTWVMLTESQVAKRVGVTDPAHVVITFVYPTRRRRDPDGLAGLAKPLLDALVSEGLLVDDDCEHIALTISARVEPKVKATQIDVYERGAA